MEGVAEQRCGEGVVPRDGDGAVAVDQRGAVGDAPLEDILLREIDPRATARESGSGSGREQEGARESQGVCVWARGGVCGRVSRRACARCTASA